LLKLAIYYIYWKSYKYNDICVDWSPVHTLSVNNMDNICVFSQCYLHSDDIYWSLNLCLWSQIIQAIVLYFLFWDDWSGLFFSSFTFHSLFFPSWLSLLENSELALWPLSSSSSIVLQFKAIALLWELYNFFIGLVSSLLLMTKF